MSQVATFVGRLESQRKLLGQNENNERDILEKWKIL